MSGKLYIGICVLVCSAVSIALAFAQSTSPITGQWTIGGPVLQDRVLLTIQCCGGTNSNMTNTMPVPLAQFRGLGRPQLESAGAVGQFQLVRDGGTLQLQGYLQNGRGGGTFTFVASPNFANEMRSLGYSDLSNEKIFVLALHDISTAYVREMNAMGIHPQSTEQLVTMGIHNLTVEYVRELQSLGLSDLSAEKLVTMRIHNVTADFARKLKRMGYTSVSSEQMVTMQIHGVSTSFINDIEALGYSHPPIEQLVTMRIHNVTPDFIRTTRARRLGNLPIEQLVSLKIHGILN